MARLKRKTDHAEIIHDLGVADGLFARMKGLLGTKSLPVGYGLWIHHCNSIHTFFMNYAIDCIFLDSEMKIVSLVANVAPGKMVWPQFGARSVVEIPAGQLQQVKLQIGEQLYVGD